MTTETGGPAFPSKQKALLIEKEHAHIAKEIEIDQNGMTLRDYFAAKAMEGIFASNTEHDHEDAHIFDAVAEAAYKQADAMLKARQA